MDPVRLITQIDEGLTIPGLRDSLVKILQDYNLQVPNPCYAIYIYIYILRSVHSAISITLSSIMSDVVAGYESKAKVGNMR